MSDELTHRIFDQLAESQRASLSELFQRQRRVISECSSQMRETITTLRQLGWSAHEKIWNAGLFINIAAHDLSILLEALVYERETWRRAFYARSLALALYEISEDLPTVFGKEFNRALITLSVPQELTTELRSNIKPIAEFWDMHRGFLKNIRSIAAAHRDHDALSMLQTIEQIDFLNLIDLGQKLGGALNAFGSRVQGVITFTSKVKPPELRT